MKKLFGFLILSFMGVGICHADLFDFTKSKEFTVLFSSQSSTGFSGTTTYTLIKLSDTTNWPHKDTGAIHITSIQTEMDKAAASTSTIRIGVVNYVGASTGSITWLATRRSEQNVSNTNVLFAHDYPDFGIYAKVRPSATANVDGATPGALSTEKSSGVNYILQNTNLPNIIGGSSFPAVGDILIELNKGATVINYSVRIKYFTEK